jgi:peptidoglycan/xylan/chitin deacetylase (PgdA/CDA1 family)
MFDEGHAVGLHSATRAYMLMSPSQFEETITRAADRIRTLAGSSPCRIFRPHAGWRTGQMYVALRRMDYRLVGWGWALWDWNWFRRRTVESVVRRILPRASAGDIIVLHDGDESAPLEDQRHTVEATAQLIPAVKDRGFEFGRICP